MGIQYFKKVLTHTLVFIELRYYFALAPNASSFLNSLHYLENFCVIDSSIQIHKCKAFQETILRHFWTSHLRRLEVGLRDRNPDQKDFRVSFSDDEKVRRGLEVSVFISNHCLSIFCSFLHLQDFNHTTI